MKKLIILLTFVFLSAANAAEIRFECRGEQSLGETKSLVTITVIQMIGEVPFSKATVRMATPEDSIAEVKEITGKCSSLGTQFTCNGGTRRQPESLRTTEIFDGVAIKINYFQGRPNPFEPKSKTNQDTELEFVFEKAQCKLSSN